MKRRVCVDPEAIRSLYESGKTLDQIARLLGTSQGTVQRRAVEAGVNLRRTGPRPVLGITTEVRAILTRSKTIDEAAKALGVSRVTAWKMRRRLVLERARA